MMNLKTLFKQLILAAPFFACSGLQAKVVLPKILTSNMVLQQKTQVSFWGKATPNKTVILQSSWNGKKSTVMADAAGNWELKVATPSYGGPYAITISDGESLKLDNILIGEVWLCSGQSNMEMPLAGWGKVTNYEQEIQDANYPNIRLLQVNHEASEILLDEANVANGGWVSCSPATIAEFSSTAYFFAREIYKNTKVPIGLIHTSWGGTIAEAWTSAATLKNREDFKVATEKIQAQGLQQNGKNKADLQAAWERDILKLDAGYKDGSYTWASDPSDAGWNEVVVPSLWEDSVLPGFDGIVYLRKKITIPDSWKAADALLNLGKIDDNDITFFDGKIIGQTDGVSKDRNYRIPAELMTPGEHIICVRVFDTGGGGGIYEKNSPVVLTGENGQKIDLSGEWQYRKSMAFKEVGPSPADASPNRPTVLFNAMINPFLKYKIKGVIWYQGESNADRAEQYRTLFPDLIKDWRDHWNVGNFPFLFVQLANFQKLNDAPVNSQWAELRNAQLETLALPNTGMAVAIDIGDAEDIHPKNKQEVGRRLALNALSKVYGKRIAYSGPMYQSMKVKNNVAELSFNFSEGLKSSNGALIGFTIAGADKVFHNADARVVGNKVIVESKDVAAPVSVRYAWSDNPRANLTNSAELPASPFKTDSW